MVTIFLELLSRISVMFEQYYHIVEGYIRYKWLEHLLFLCDFCAYASQNDVLLKKKFNVFSV